MTKRYSKIEALRIIQRILKNGEIAFTAHSEDRMIERRFDMQDFFYVLKKGKIIKEPEIHLKTGHWIYRVEGKTLDDKTLKISVDIEEEENRINILTGFGL